MALNKFMHPRNLYKNKKPNFQNLALKYPDFRKFVFPDVTGKLFLDFKHPDSLRQLSITLLKEDFDLKLELPLDRLVPTVPLRLNYIHWLEDVLTASRAGKCIKGIDIGTGSSCIYPLLSCRINKDWTFLASEVDEKNFIYTQRNIENNGMKERIKVKRASAVDETVLCSVLEDESDMFDFCMCNPPFFADHLEAQAVAKSRNYSRTDPKSACTASFTESIVEGGEVNFLKRMIKDSMELRNKIRIYSSMIGKKSSLPPLKEELRRLQVPKFTTTEFCQGKTMRWGLAWTFDQTVSFPKSLFQESKKERPPLVYQVPRSTTDLDYDVTHISARIRAMLADLKIQYDITLNQKSLVRMTLVAKENTWSNQRRKRRQKKQQKAKEEMEPSTGVENLNEITKGEPCDAKSQCEDHLSASNDTKIDQQNIANNLSGNSCSKDNEEKHLTFQEKTSLDEQEMVCVEDSNKESVSLSSISVQAQSEEIMIDKNNIYSSPSSSVTEKGKKRKLPGSDEKPEVIDRTLEPSAKRQMLNSETESNVVINPESKLKIEPSLSSTKEAESICLDKKTSEEMVNGYCEHFGESVEEKVFLKCFLKVKLSTPHVVVEMMWVEGENRESMHQVLQYIKNRTSVTI
ncbi:RNA N6-adenosine-methyltransferase mettl16-like [Pecten maximus]|uniref:RNA N6-adenosine-methyltransferase mettl16-like n=1 Tax=Pecten maximus TaxID=6579 RepID=UPI0014588CB6|nr:RNA N6-adenosine-methyltransferase mettl16-like [Pecten maximus]